MRSILKLDFGCNLEHLLVEILFGQIFELPFPPYRQIYYGDLIVDGYKTNQEFSEALAEAIHFLFRKLSEFDAECFDRFSEWFSFHLSSIDWKWDWEKWNDVLDHPNTSHQRRFISEVIEQCIRLSYYERIIKIIPESFHILLPAKPGPSYSYSDSKVAHQILMKVYEKVSSDVLQEIINQSDFSSEEEKLDILIHVLLYRGHKCTTHILKLFERYLILLQSLITTTNLKICVLNAVQSFWINCPQNIIIIVDKLMTYCIVDNFSIEKWILSSKSGNQLKQYVLFFFFCFFSASNQFYSGYMWIILRKTIEKTRARLETIEKLIPQVENGEIKFEDDPNNPDAVKNRKVASLKQQKIQSGKELETLLMTTIIVCTFKFLYILF